jgi:putative radical SAM enzyme (TIGR03279 family)
VKITTVEPGSIAADLGLLEGDEVLEINGRKVLDAIDFRFQEADPEISVKIARHTEVTIYDIEKEQGESLGIDFEEMKVLACGNDCIFCFVDQNPEGLRKPLYFRDGDYRLSFMYGNYTTMTNAGPAILKRIVDQRLSPQYISVHVTDYAVRKLLMGLRKDDQILEKIGYLHDHGIDMHTQIVLCPGINDGDILQRTVADLYRFRERIISLAIVPVGLTDHRFNLFRLRKVDSGYARDLLVVVGEWQKQYRKEIGRNFVYPSDEFFIVAGEEIPSASYYDGFPQIENGVGLVRSFLHDFQKQARRFPVRLSSPCQLTVVTGELASGFLNDQVLPRLRTVGGLNVDIVTAPNVLYGRSVTVAGLLSGKCIYSALEGRECGHLVLLPPEVLNQDGLFLDDTTVDHLATRLGVPVMVFDGSWPRVFESLHNG